MSKKKLSGDGIFFTGKASDEVTGSQYLIKLGKYQCLLECGLHQSSRNNYLDSYRINSEKFGFRPSEIDFVFIAHPHIDHCGLIPRLVNQGFHGKFIATENTAIIMKPLLLNSCYIAKEEAKILSKRFGREYAPLYEENDVYNALKLIDTYSEYNVVFRLNDCISFQWLRNSHCIGAAQLQLIYSTKEKTRKILYTSDIGSLKTNNHYLKNTEIPTMFNDVVIMEATYGDSKHDVKRSRSSDVEHLRVAIDTALERNGTVVFPCFSFARTQEILTVLYDIYGNNEKFLANIIVDSKLSCDICKLYSSTLSDGALQKWEEVYNWKNVQYISEKIESQKCIADQTPKIVLSSSGFCTNGRVVGYLQKYLKDRNSAIIFTGYAGDNKTYLSYRIKNCREHKYITINKEKVPNNADCITLSTFSSHASQKDLIEYGSSLNTNKLILVHGSTESKKCLSEKLSEAISQNDKTYHVYSAFRGMILHL